MNLVAAAMRRPITVIVALIAVTLSALLAHQRRDKRNFARDPWIGLAPACIGLSHVIVYVIGKRREN